MTSIPEIHCDSFRMTDVQISIWFWWETSDYFSTCCSEMFFHEVGTDLNISAWFMEISEPSFREHCREYALSGVICGILSNRFGTFRFRFFLLLVMHKSVWRTFLTGVLSRSSFGPRSSSNFLLTISVRNLGSAHLMSGLAASSLRVVSNALYRSSMILSLFVDTYLLIKSSSSPSVTWTPTPDAASKSDSTQRFSVLWIFEYSTAATSSAKKSKQGIFYLLLVSQI